MRHVTIIATSLNPNSRSQILARKFADYLKAQNVIYETIDLRELDLPLAGPKSAWEHPGQAQLSAAVARASHVVFALPIYCYDVSAATKNVIELVGRGFSEKVVGFMCAAGGTSSYMAVMGLANHLMLDFRSVIVPRFLYVSSQDWGEDGELDPAIEGRLALMYEDMRRITVAPA